MGYPKNREENWSALISELEGLPEPNTIHFWKVGPRDNKDSRDNFPRFVGLLENLGYTVIDLAESDSVVVIVKGG